MRPAACAFVNYSHMNFTRSFRKVLLIEDVENLGFKGEWTFVKPGYAFNKLVPEKKALFATDPASLKIKVDVNQISF